MVGSLRKNGKYNCTVSACVSMSLDLSRASLSDYGTVCLQYSMCLCTCMHAYIYSLCTVCMPSPSSQIICNLVLNDLMQVEGWRPFGVSLVPNAHHAAGLPQISATFTLLTANFPGLLHVFHPRHQHGEDPKAFVACQQFSHHWMQKLLILYLLVLNERFNYLLLQIIIS